MSSNFDEVWKRVQKECQIKNMTHLSRVVEVSQQNVSKKKKEGIFPPEWGYRIAVKYNILTEWVMTGNGPKSLNEMYVHGERNSSERHPYKIIRLFTSWFDELITHDPEREKWFQYQLIDAFPKFEIWMNSTKTKEKKEEFLGGRVREPVD
jgi:hypothetical protein